MQSAWCRACSEIWWSTSMSFIAEAMYWFHFLAGKQCGHILLNLDGKPDLTTLDVWEDSSTKLPFLARSAEVYFQSEMLQRLHKRERERERKKTFGASRVSLFFVFVKKPCLSEMGTDVVSDPQSCSPSTSGRWRPSTKTLPQVDAGQCAAPVFSLKGPVKLSQGLMLYTHKGCNFPCSQAAEELPILQD